MLYRNYCTEALIVVLALLLIAAQPTQAFVGTTPFIYILPENQSNADAAGWIGHNYSAGSMSDPMGGDWWAHKGLHAGLGCVGAAAQSGDCSSGAFGAVAGEIVAEQIGGSLIEDGDFSSTDKWLVKVGGQSAAIFGADAVGLDYNDANNAAENAIENNVLETLWDIANIAIGSIELYKALKDGDTEGAIAAAIAVGADTLAAILPFVPGGASTVLRATRAAAKLKNGKKLTKAEQAALHAVDKAKAIKAKAKSKGGVKGKIDPKRIKHIFRDKDGHLPDTRQNRKLLEDIENNPSTTLGKDKFGNTWSAQTRPDGTQVWTQSRDGKIVNGGLNQAPKKFNPETGLSSPVKPR